MPVSSRSAASRFAKKEYLWLFLLFFGFPVASFLWFNMFTAVLEYYGISYSQTFVILLARILVMVGNLLSPALFCAGACLLGHCAFRMTDRVSIWALPVAIGSLFLTGGMRILISYLLTAWGYGSETLASFLFYFPWYLAQIAIYSILQALALVLLFALFRHSGKKMRKREELLFPTLPAFSKGRFGYGALNFSIWFFAAFVMLDYGLTLVSAFSQILEIYQNYGGASEEFLVSILTGVLLPLLFAVLSVLLLRKAGLWTVAIFEKQYLKIQQKSASRSINPQEDTGNEKKRTRQPS